MVNYKCAHCGKDFLAKASSKRVYCSLDCSVNYKRSRNMHKCHRCGKDFYRVGGHARRAKVGIFCGRKCFDEWEHGQNNPAYSGGKVERQCEGCGKSFAIKPSHAKRGGNAGRFCSCKCRAKFYSGQNNPRYTERLIINCDICGNVISLPPSHAAGKRFCSKRCQGKSKQIELTGENNGRYLHGESNFPYALTFTRRLCKSVRDRHADKCALCGETRQGNGNRGMDVHHIDYNKRNSDYWNLIPLCKSCHGKMHGTPDQRKQWSEKLSRLLSEFKTTLAQSTT